MSQTVFIRGLLVAAAVLSAGCGDKAPSEETRELSFGHVGAPGSLFALTAEEFARRVNERLDGEAEVVVYGSSQRSRTRTLSGRADLRQRILLPVHHTRAQRQQNIRKGHRDGVGAELLEKLDPPGAARGAQLDPFQVARHAHRAHVVGDVAEAVLPHGQNPVAFGLRERHQSGPHDRLLDAGHVVAVVDQVRHLEEPELRNPRRHDRREQRHVDGPQLQLLQQNVVAPGHQTAVVMLLAILGVVTYAPGFSMVLVELFYR